MRKVSPRQARELKKRRILKAKLIEECGGVCPDCGGEHQDWRGLSLSHKSRLSKGRKSSPTNRINCKVQCYYCHNREFHGIREIEHCE